MNAQFSAVLQNPTPKTFKARTIAMLLRGIPIIPLQPRDKNPCTNHAAYDATSDSAVIAEWVRKYNPASNCGAVARYDGCWMLDDDTGTLAQKYKEDTGQDLPQTFTVKTSRGFHYYFVHDAVSRLIRYDDNDNSGVIKVPGYKGEARCNNQYVVAPGSVHPSGAIYEICNDAQLVAAPVLLLEWLQKAFALSESLKPDADKPKTNGKSDPGFRKVFDAVGYRPLVKRINALSDDRLHVSDFEQGETVPCPMPHHEHDDYSKCFGSIKNAPERLKCLGKCQWTGDMVAAIYALDGGSAKYKNMYDCARAICKEEDLKFEDFFPANQNSYAESGTNPTQAMVEVNEPDALAVIPPIMMHSDMSHGVLCGRLGDICSENLLNDFPVSYAWPSLVTAASVLVPERITSHGDNPHNLYTALVGRVNSGKSQCIEWATYSLRIQDDPTRFTEVKPGSAERLLKYLNRLHEAGQLSPRVLMLLDEWKYFFDKAAIENSVFPSLLTTGFYHRNQPILDSHGHPLNVCASMSWLGGIVDDAYEECFSRAASLGLHDRFLHGVQPVEYAGFNYRPFDGKTLPDGFTPAAVEAAADVWECLREWKTAHPAATREAELALRVAYICASFDGKRILHAQDLEPHWILADEQIKIRETLKPNVGETADAQCSIKVERYLKANGPNGEWMDFRTMMKAIHYERFGPNVLERTIKGMCSLNIADVTVRSPKPAEVGAGGRPAKVIRLVLS